jgi:hypothetical protein
LNRRRFLEGVGAGGAFGLAGPGSGSPLAAAAAADDRGYWVESLTRIARPVVESLAKAELKRRLPVQAGRENRQAYAPLEALGRMLAGIAPWLELGEDPTSEGRSRGEWISLVRRGLAAAVDPASPDFMNFREGSQPLVDAAFLAQGLLRAPRALKDALPKDVRANLLRALRETRRIRPYYSNWLLFSAMIEALLLDLGEDWDPMRVDLALRTLVGWHVGDGHYKDGPEYHHDYYGSFVIQPFLLTILGVLQARKVEGYEAMHALVASTSARYADLLERSISPEGTFPVVGRSLTYRFGAFQLLAQVALERRLPAGLAPAQVRGALTAVIRRSLEAPGTFDAAGWLQPGLAGHQPGLMERYISRGSLYLCCVAFLPLGLPPSDAFWSAPAADWTSRRAWRGADLPADHALELPPPPRP